VPLYIDVEELVKVLFGDFIEGNEFTDAGVGKNNIDSALHLGHRLEKTIEICQFGDVSLKTPATLLPIAATASSSSFLRRPVMNT
jgi:hypothetical protein